MGRGGRVFFTICALLMTVGCAGSGESDLQRLNREQALTIDSLNKEVARLNQELDVVAGSRSELAKAKTDLEQKLRAELASGQMSVAMESRGLVLTVQNQVLFDSGRCEVKASAKQSLGAIAEVLKKRAGKNLIHIEGHTDNVPIRVSGWKSNWELSTARATEVIHAFVDDYSLNPKLFAAVGYGEFHPVRSNETPEGRQKNRRVEIVVSPKKAV